jgi:hypothetical protein
MTSVIECIKHENMVKHYQNLKSLNLDNEELKNTIEQFNTKLSNENKKIHLPIPNEIMNNFNKKPWIRIPYPIREVKLVEFMKEKKYTTIQKDTILKLLYEKKLTNKIVTYNTETGKIEEITLEN